MSAALSMTRLSAALLLLSLLALLAACGSQPAAPPREVRAVPEAPDPERQAQVRLELASAYFGRGQSDTALEEIKRALVAKPDMPQALNLQGLIYAALGDRARAEASFQRALQVKPNDPDTQHNYAWFLCQNARYVAAQAQFDGVLAQPQYPDVVRTLLAKGVCQARAGQWAEAEKTLLRSYELDPGNPATGYNLSEVLYRQGQFERARFYIRRVNSQPQLSNAQSLWLAARIERRLGNSAGLEDYGRQLRDRFPKSPEALQLEQGRFDD